LATRWQPDRLHQRRARVAAMSPARRRTGSHTRDDRRDELIADLRRQIEELEQAMNSRP
jgi:hypothetical protein